MGFGEAFAKSGISNNTQKKPQNDSHNSSEKTIVTETNPYNFIPLNEKVVFPNWAKDVSFDYPLKDSLTGEIEITLKAHSPIIVADSKGKDDKSPREFCKTADGRYFIPATTIKGAIRSVFEIFSFSKMRQINEYKFAYRDFDLDGYLDEMKKTRSGWLQKVDGKYIVQECNYGRVPYSVLGNLYKKLDIKKRSDATERYRSVDFENKEKLEVFVNKDKYTISKHSGDKIYENIVQTEKSNATVVFTGSAVGNDPIKNHGFLFFEDIKEKQFEISNEVYENFLQAYYNNEPDESTAWKYFKNRLKKGLRIPVFFQEEQSCVLHFGLSKLYKLHFKYSVKEIIERFPDHKSEDLDMSQTLFGYVQGAKALRGRVQFSHLLTEQKKPNKKYSLILGTPKGTFYPFYLTDNGKITNYNQERAKISGYKKYPVHSNFQLEKVGSKPTHKNTKVTTHFYPLPKDRIFTGKIKFFNLKKEELGGLLSALTLHNNRDFYHSVGFAKPFGFGKSSIKVKVVDRKNNPLEVSSCLKIFEKYMEKELDKSWINSPQIKEFFALSNSDHSLSFIYPQIDKIVGEKSNGKPDKRNEFQSHKRSGKSLTRFSKLSNFTQKIESAL